MDHTMFYGIPSMAQRIKILSVLINDTLGKNLRNSCNIPPPERLNYIPISEDKMKKYTYT